jgi:hypothetical protein
MKTLFHHVRTSVLAKYSDDNLLLSCSFFLVFLLLSCLSIISLTDLEDVYQTPKPLFYHFTAQVHSSSSPPPPAVWGTGTTSLFWGTEVLKLNPVIVEHNFIWKKKCYCSRFILDLFSEVSLIYSPHVSCRHAVVWLHEALCYKPEACGFDSW